jgi:hypothetical protein
MQWFQTNIIDKELTHVPVSTFIKMIVEEVLNSLLAEECFGVDFHKKLMIRTSFFTAAEGRNGKDILLNSYANHLQLLGDEYLDIDKLESPIFEIKGRHDGDGDANSGDIEEYTNYILVYASAQNLISTKIEGNPAGNKIPLISQLRAGTLGEEDSGVEEWDDPITGDLYTRPTGKRIQTIVQTISFSKTDTKYLREARYANATTNHLTLLGNVYDATVVMKGVTFFYPGQMIFIDPGIQTTIPAWKENSIANQIGMGGYYLIYEVSHSLKNSDASLTTIKAKWHHSGYGDDFRVGTGEPKNIAEPVSIATDRLCDRLIDAATEITGIEVNEYGVGDVEEAENIANEALGEAVDFRESEEVFTINELVDLDHVSKSIRDKQPIFDLLLTDGTPIGATAHLVERESHIQGEIAQWWEVINEQGEVLFYYGDDPDRIYTVPPGVLNEESESHD